MRWIVEVSSIGKAEKQGYCVESESWQRALQTARGLRDDHAPMTGFSIELLDEGFSAVDPMTRLRYFIKRAPDDTPITEPTKPAQAAPSTQPVQAVVPSSPPPAAAATQPSSQTSKTAPRPTASTPPKKANLSKTFVFGSTGAVILGDEKKAAAIEVPKPLNEAAAPPMVQPAEIKPPVVVRSEPPRPSPGVKSVPPPAVAAAPPPAEPVAIAAPVPRPTTTSSPPSPAAPVAASEPPAASAVAPIASPPTLPGIEVLFKREQDPDARSPLSYREYVYFFAAASDETMAKAMLVAQFDLVKTSLQRARPGKLINLAMFDVAFTGKPPVMPVVTLSWKDWKGDPVIDFPRRAARDPSDSSEQAIPLVARASPNEARGPDSVVPSPAPAVPVPVRGGFPSPQVAPAETVAAEAPAPAAPALVAVSAVVHPIVKPVPTPTPSTAGKRGGSKPNIRLRGDELIADLFEVMHDLHFLRDSLEGADFCLTLALEKMPARGGIAHLYDIDRREFVVTCVRGHSLENTLARRYPESDPILIAAMRRQHAIVFSDTSSANELERYRAFGGAKALVVAPVVLNGRFLGALELMDPLDGSPYGDDEGHALTYIAEQFAEFVSTRGVNVDPERIAASARAP